MELELVRFINSHDNWEELLTAEPYCLKISKEEIYNGGIPVSNYYALFKYDQLNSDFSNPIVQESHGIILEILAGEVRRVACWPMAKFFNYGEVYAADIDWSTASVQEKVDGSLIKVWHSGTRWKVSTNGAINAYNAVYDVDGHSFGDLFDETVVMPYWRLDPEYTYMFELVSPQTRVVVPYPEAKVYYLGRRNNITGQEEYNPHFYNSVLAPEGILTPKRYQAQKLEDVIAMANELPWDEEGYVVCDAHFNRIKVKSPQYVIAHYNRTNGVLGDRRLLDVILTGEEGEFLVYASQYEERIKELRHIMTDIGNEAQSARVIIEELDFFYHYDAKSFAELVKIAIPCGYLRSFIFKSRQYASTWYDYTKNWDSYKWERAIEEYKGNK